MGDLESRVESVEFKVGVDSRGLKVRGLDCKFRIESPSPGLKV